MPALYSHTTRANGTVLTATIYNGDHQNHIDNGVPAQLDDFSVNVGQMQSQVSPGTVGAENQPTSLAGEIERLRYVIAQMKGTSFWYGPNAAGGLIGIQVLASSGNYTETSGTTQIVWYLLGGGGAGGGAPATGVGQLSAGEGGGSGGLCIGRSTSSFSGAAFTIGAAGAATSGAAGGDGGNSTFMGATAGGGLGGVTGGPSGPAFIGVGTTVRGGTATGGIINIPGQDGTYGSAVALSSGCVSGAGGSTMFGHGGDSRPGTTAGRTATGFGAGGGGAANFASSAAAAGGPGAAGVLIIFEYA